MADPVVAVQPEAPPAEPTKAPEIEVDWKARAEQAEARAEAHEAQVAGLTKAFGSQIADNNALTEASAAAIRSGDWEPYEKLLAERNEKRAKADIAAANQVVIDRAAASIGKVEQKLGKDFADLTDPMFEPARVLWRKGEFAAAAIAANEIYAEQMEGQTVAEKKATAKAVADARAAAVKETEEKLGKFELGAGPEAGGDGTLSLADLSKKPTKGMSPKELREHGLALDKAMGFKNR